MLVNGKKNKDVSATLLAQDSNVTSYSNNTNKAWKGDLNLIAFDEIEIKKSVAEFASTLLRPQREGSDWYRQPR